MNLLLYFGVGLSVLTLGVVLAGIFFILFVGVIFVAHLLFRRNSKKVQKFVNFLLSTSAFSLIIITITVLGYGIVEMR